MTGRRDKIKENRSQLYRQIEWTEAEQKMIERKKKLNLWKGNFFTDIAKLVFAGVILGGVFERLEHPYILYGAGIAGFMVSITLGYAYYKHGI